MIRQPIVAIMGHVDHGKTLVLDKIRGTAVAAKEHGGITQAIGASIIPIDTIKKVCGNLLGSMKITIPGLLFVDTPGHAAFNSLRKRGGNLADIAILVIDINEGFKPQTIESMEILKAFKTPFIIAANKIDLISGWRKEPGKSILKKIAEQNDSVQQELDKKIYEIVGKVYEYGLEAERFDRVSDYTKQIAIVPTSAVTGDGIPELLMVLTGLAQKFLEDNLKVDLKGAAQGTVLEVKEEKGLGKTMDTIIYNGSLNVGDTVVVGGMSGPIAAKVKALFMPAPLAEMREKRTKFKSVKEVHAANGVKIVAPGTEDVVSGMPMRGAGDDVEKTKEEVQSEVKEVLTEATAKEGILIKADSLGSLEALAVLLKEKNIPVQKASVGTISKRDISDAEANYEKDPLRAVILGFNIPMPESIPSNVKIIAHPVIYKVIEDYEEWVEKTKRDLELAAMGVLTKPAKVKILKGYTFRQSNPAVVGVEIIIGTLTNNIRLMNPDGKILTPIKGMQLEQKNIESAEKGKQVAISLPDVTVGRQIKEGDILYSYISEEDFKKFKEYKQYLSDEEKELLKEIAEIMRRNNPVWGV